MRWALVLLLMLTACEREQRQYQLPAPQASFVKQGHVLTEHNAYAMSQGKTLFRWFNCSGCHANGGGGMGPALIDDQWRYGAEIEQVYASIAQGRPNGMPSFQDKVPPAQIWELAAYVRSLSGNVPKAAAGSRGEEMANIPPQTLMKPLPAKADASGVGVPAP